MKRTKVGLVVALAVLCVGAFCPRKPTEDPACRNGQTRCAGYDGGAPLAEVCHGGGWYPADPVEGPCPAQTVCCLTDAVRDAGRVYACALPARCVAPEVDAAADASADGE